MRFKIGLKRNIIKPPQKRGRKPKALPEKQIFPLDNFQCRAGYSRISPKKLGVFKKNINDPFDGGVDFQNNESFAKDMDGEIVFSSSGELDNFVQSVLLEQFLWSSQQFLEMRLFSSDNKMIRNLYLGILSPNLFLYYFCNLGPLKKRKTLQRYQDIGRDGYAEVISFYFVDGKGQGLPPMKTKEWQNKIILESVPAGQVKKRYQYTSATFRCNSITKIVSVDLEFTCHVILRNGSQYLAR